MDYWSYLLLKSSGGLEIAWEVQVWDMEWNLFLLGVTAYGWEGTVRVNYFSRS